MIFVFGSNLAGRHGAGAALYAATHHGAVAGAGEGPMGESYALPTKGRTLDPLDLDVIKMHVERFITYARLNPNLRFHVTRVGCGLAGYNEGEMRPLFEGAPANCDFDDWDVPKRTVKQSAEEAVRKTRPFSELKDAMSPESRTRIDRMVDADLAAIEGEDGD